VKNTRLCQLLLKLNSNELRSLHKLVRSPYFNNNKKCVELLDILLEFHEKGFEDDTLTLELVFSQLFPEKKKMTRTLNSTMSELVELINELKIQQKLKQKQILRQHFLLESLYESGERKYFESVYQKTQKRFKNITNRNTDYYLERYLLSMDNLGHLVGEHDFDSGQYLAEVIHHLDTFYFGQKLHLTCGLYSLKHIKPKDYEPVLLDGILETTTSNQYQEYGLIQLYRQAFLMISEQEGEDHFELFMKLFWGDHTDSLGKRELEDLFKIATNYCIQKIRNGNSIYFQKMFELYEVMFDRKLMFSGKYIHQLHLHNMIVLSCNLDQTDQAFELNETYIQHVHPKYRTNAHLYHKAFIYFYKKEFGEAMTCLAKIDETDELSSSRIRSLLLKCYYELEERNAFYGLCTSFRAYLRNRKKHPSREKSFQNFIRFSRQLYKIKEGFSKKSLTSIEEEIQTTKPIAGIKWLLEKLEELK